MNVESMFFAQENSDLKEQIKKLRKELAVQKGLFEKTLESAEKIREYVELLEKEREEASKKIYSLTELAEYGACYTCSKFWDCSIRRKRGFPARQCKSWEPNLKQEKSDD